MSNSNLPFNVLIGPECGVYIREIEYVFSELAVRLGCSFNLHESVSEEIDIVYGAIPDNRLAFLKFDARCYQNKTDIFSCFKDTFLWGASDIQKQYDLDLIGGIFRILTMADENHIQDSQRDQRGIFLVDDLPGPRAEVYDKPLVEYHVSEVANLLRIVRPSFEIDRNKFFGNRNVLLLTHDTDAVDICSPMEIIFNFGKSIFRRDSVRREMCLYGVKNFGGDLKSNPLYGFKGWNDFTKERNMKSAFYLFSRTHVRATINDCRSSVQTNGFEWQDLRAMHDDGYEFGFHAPINAKHSLDEFILSKAYIEDQLKAPIFGLRHHYWAVDWKSPYRTYRLHENAGFRYDLSNAWRDKVGFRAGTCLPFKPWDPQRKRSLDLYSIPLTIMDGHLMHSGDLDLDAKLAATSEIIREVRDAGGVIVLDWHTETVCNDFCFKDYVTLLDNLLSVLLGDESLVVSTPMQLTELWHNRRKKYSVRRVR